MERRQFVKESLALGFERDEVFELTKLTFTDAKDKDIEHDIDSSNVPEEKIKSQAVVKQTTENTNTIHAIIMAGLRGGKDNTSIITDLVKEHPEVDIKKLKQRMYEYRNHFNKGKIK